MSVAARDVVADWGRSNLAATTRSVSRNAVDGYFSLEGVQAVQ